jgi:GT2 family glycosyltransferase
VSEVDVVNVYKIFLGRSPEDQSVIDDKRSFSIDGLINFIINSDECVRDVLNCIILGNIENWSRYKSDLNADLILWVEEVFDLNIAAQNIKINKYWSKLISSVTAVMRGDPEFSSTNHIILSAEFEDALLRWYETERASSIIGGLDFCDARRVMGWVLDRDDLDVALIVEIFANGRFVAAARADKFRRELQATYGGGGIFGFSVDLNNTFDVNDGRPLKIELVESVTRNIVATAHIERQIQRPLDLLDSINTLLRDIKEKINTIESQIPAIRNVTSFSVESYSSYAEAYAIESAHNKSVAKSYWKNSQSFPLISIIIIVDGDDVEYLDKTIQSVSGQSYKNIDVIIAYTEPRDAVRARPWLDALLATLGAPTRQLWPETAVNRDAVLSSAIAATKGDLVCQVHSGDLLAECAMHQIAKAANEQPHFSVYLSDEDEFNRISDSHVLYHSPKFNPDYDPLLLAQVELFGGVIAVRGGFIRDLEASNGLAHEDTFDRLVQICDAAGEHGVKHIPRVLLHRSRPRPQVDAAQLERRRAYIQARLDRRGEPGIVEIAQDPLGATVPGSLRVAPAGLEGVTATIIIPTRDNYDLLRPCIDGLIKTMESNVVKFDIVIIDNGSTSPKILDYFIELRAHDRVDVIRDDRPFNWAALNNEAAKRSASDVIIFMNDDMLPIIKNWCDEMCFWALRPGTGAVGTRLLYGDGSIQHAGIVGGVFGLAAHEGVGAAGTDPGYLGRHALVRKAIAVTGACMAVRRSIFEQLGGFDADTFAVAYNDLDFCLRAAQANLSVIYTPYASFYHFESQSRGFDFQAPPPDKIERSREARAALLRWGEQLLNDRTYNPHFERWTRPFTRLTAVDAD